MAKTLLREVKPNKSIDMEGLPSTPWGDIGTSVVNSSVSTKPRMNRTWPSRPPVFHLLEVPYFVQHSTRKFFKLTGCWGRWLQIGVLGGVGVSIVFPLQVRWQRIAKRSLVEFCVDLFLSPFFFSFLVMYKLATVEEDGPCQWASGSLGVSLKIQILPTPSHAHS
jgi:hypothetical protein